MRKTENEEVNNIMLESFKKCRAQNIPVTGPMLQAKAVSTLLYIKQEIKYEYG